MSGVPDDGASTARPRLLTVLQPWPLSGAPDFQGSSGSPDKLPPGIVERSRDAGVRPDPRTGAADFSSGGQRPIGTFLEMNTILGAKIG